MANHKGPDFTMNHSIIGRALLLGALLLGGIAHAETEDIPLPGDVQNTPLKSARKPAHHSNSASTASSQGVRKHASKPGRKHHASTRHGKHHGQKATIHKPGKQSPVAANKAAAKKSISHKSSKNNKLKKKAGKKHKKLH
jgi:hypothetical protein